MNSNSNDPLTPQELFNRLMSGNYRQSQCIDQASKVNQQRNILIELNASYEQEIRKAQQIFMEEQALIDHKKRLLLEIQAIKIQRCDVQTRIGQQIQSLRRYPGQMHDQESWHAAVSQAKSKNNKLRIRIKELLDYIAKLEVQNRKLQQQKRIISVAEMQRRQYGADWASKIQVLKKQHQSYGYELKRKLRCREQQSLRSIQAQQMQIHQRNRQRINSLRLSPQRNISYLNPTNIHIPYAKVPQHYPPYKYVPQTYTPYKNLDNIPNRQNVNPHFYRMI